MSRLETNSKAFRDKLLNKTLYTANKPYESGNSRALSDGDEHGKGENNGNIGGKTDVIIKNSLLSKNKYNTNKPYNLSNA
jgi:hypothetical protein